MANVQIPSPALTFFTIYLAAVTLPAMVPGQPVQAAPVTDTDITGNRHSNAGGGTAAGLPLLPVPMPVGCTKVRGHCGPPHCLDCRSGSECSLLTQC